MASSPRSSTDYSFDGASMFKETRDAGTQTDINPKDYVPARVLSRFDLETETYPRIVQRPWMLSCLFVICGTLLYLVANYEIPFSPSSFVENSKKYTFFFELHY